MVAIDAHSFRVRIDTCLREVFCKGWCSRKLHQSLALAAGSWPLEKISTMKDSLPHSFPSLAALHSSSSLTPRRARCRGLSAGLLVFLLSVLCGETPSMVLSFKEHVVGNQELGAGRGRGTGPDQVLKFLYEQPARLQWQVVFRVGGQLEVNGRRHWRDIQPSRSPAQAKVTGKASSSLVSPTLGSTHLMHLALD